MGFLLVILAACLGVCFCYCGLAADAGFGFVVVIYDVWYFGFLWPWSGYFLGLSLCVIVVI